MISFFYYLWYLPPLDVGSTLHAMLHHLLGIQLFISRIAEHGTNMAPTIFLAVPYIVVIVAS